MSSFTEDLGGLGRCVIGTTESVLGFKKGQDRGWGWEDTAVVAVAAPVFRWKDFSREQPHEAFRSAQIWPLSAKLMTHARGQEISERENRDVGQRKLPTSSADGMIRFWEVSGYQQLVAKNLLPSK